MARLSELWSRGRAVSTAKFQRDAVWNLGSVGMLAVCGFAINLGIGRHYGAEAFGIYNQVWAAYIFFSQAAVGGLDRSVLRAISERRDDRARVTAVIIGGLLPAMLLATLASLAFWWIRHPLAALLESPGVAEGIEVATPGLFFFALNKVGLAVVNGAQRMRAFAVYNSLRYLAMVAGLLVVVFGDFSPTRIAFLFTFAECVLFLPLCVEVARQLGAFERFPCIEWSREHLRYGAKSVASGMLLELNSRIDVLMLGFFLADGPVGVYSFAAFVAEGVFQVLVVLQNNYNPILAEHIAAGRLAELTAIVRRGKRVTYALFAVVGSIAFAGFPVFLAVLDKPEFQAGWIPFGWILLGMLIASGFMPFAQTLLMANRPGRHTFMMSSIVLVNVYGNAVLIPIFGLQGAALATATCLVVSAIALRGSVERWVGLKL